MSAHRPQLHDSMKLLECKIEEAKIEHEELLTTAKEMLARAQDVKASIDTMEKEYAILHNQCSTIYTLPNEILSEIFECLFHSSHHSAGDSLPYELCISHVSRRWRDIAIGSQILWTKLKIKDESPTDMISSYINRSGGRSLDVAITLSMTSKEAIKVWPVSLQILPLARQLLLECQSWYTLRQILDDLLVLHAPYLQSLHIYTRAPEDSDEYTPNPLRQILINGASALSDLRLIGWTLPRCLPPLSAVTSLALHDTGRMTGWHEFRDILDGQTALTYLDIGDIFVYDSFPDDFECAIRLPALCFLQISMRGRCPYPEDILAVIHAPALVELRMVRLGWQDFEDLSQKLSSSQMLHHFPSLRTIVVVPGHSTGLARPWIAFLSIFPQVKKVTLTRDCYDGQRLSNDNPGYSDSQGGLLNGFIHNCDAPTTALLLLPQLQVLSFSELTTSSINPMIEVILRRQSRGLGIKELHLPSALMSDPDFAENLTRFREMIEVKEYQIGDTGFRLHRGV